MDDNWKLIYKTYYKPLLIYALSLTHNIVKAEDLVSETFIKAMLSYQNPEINGKFKAWLCIVLKNLFLDQCRKNKLLSFNAEEIIDNACYYEDVIDDMFLEERKCWVYKKILSLPKLQQQVILLTSNFELNDTEIALQLNITEEYVRTLRHRGKATLMDWAKKEGYYG